MPVSHFKQKYHFLVFPINHPAKLINIVFLYQRKITGIIL